VLVEASGLESLEKSDAAATRVFTADHAREELGQEQQQFGSRLTFGYISLLQASCGSRGTQLSKKKKKFFFLIATKNNRYHVVGPH